MFYYRVRIFVDGQYWSAVRIADASRINAVLAACQSLRRVFVQGTEVRVECGSVRQQFVAAN